MEEQKHTNQQADREKVGLGGGGWVRVDRDRIDRDTDRETDR